MKTMHTDKEIVQKIIKVPMKVKLEQKKRCKAAIRHLYIVQDIIDAIQFVTNRYISPDMLIEPYFSEEIKELVSQDLNLIDIFKTIVVQAEKKK